MKSYFLWFVLVGSGFAADWRPIDPSELAQKTPRVDPAADAEAIFWEVSIEDRIQGSDLSLTMNHYIRIKIFTERGKEEYTTIEIPRIGKRSINDVAGRTIKADGTILDVKKDAIFDRQLVKTKGAKLSGKTFALPNVEVGDIIEYRYREVRDKEIASHLRLYFQRELPIWNVTYHLKPLSIPWLPYGMRTMAFHCRPEFQREPNGFYTTTITNVPAFKEEAYMPPQDEIRAWMLVYYEEDRKIDAEKYWREIGRGDYGRLKPFLKVDDPVKRLSAELTSGATTPEDKLAALDLHCRTKIRNLNNPVFHFTPEERKSFKENHTPGDTLKQGMGTGMDIDLLFAALANAAGFESRMARVANRADAFFSPQRTLMYFLSNFSVGVKVNDHWMFFDPSTPYLERGLIRWQEEGQQALISDPKDGFFVITPYAQPERSKRQRSGVFKLLEDGSLEGTVSYTYTGHVAETEKEHYQEMTPAQQEEDWKDSMTRRLSTAELSKFQMQNATDPLKPVIVTHEVSVPGYATRTGKRILLQPAFFERNLGPRFSESTRRWDIYFDYGWSEEDSVTIEAPEGWVLDQPTAPASSTFGDVGDYTVKLQQTRDGKKIIYSRHFSWGRDLKLLLPAEIYPNVKKAFDFVRDQDNFTVTLKPQAGANER